MLYIYIYYITASAVGASEIYTNIDNTASEIDVRP